MEYFSIYPSKGKVNTLRIIFCSKKSAAAMNLLAKNFFSGYILLIALSNGMEIL